MLEIISVIPARHGSEGVPSKNIHPLAGKPLIAYTIEHSLASKKINRTIVSTDSLGIAIVARKYGAEVIPRPPELATSTSPSELALLHVLEQVEADMVVMLQPTSPLRKPDDIDNAIEATDDSLFSCYRSHNLYWSMVGGMLSPNYYERPRRQDMPVEYIENGSIYVTRASILKKYGNRLGGRISMYEMSPLYSFQMDTEEDFLIMERLMNERTDNTG